MTQKEKYIWYASYGSNILEKRFLCYIQGGQPDGSPKVYDGCNDKSLPIDKEEIYIKSELYFAKHSNQWNGGVCFIKTNFEPQQQTLGRMYLITKEQFADIVKQETNSEQSPNINLEKAITDGSLTFSDGSWYGNIIYLGTQYESPIFTFTHQDNITPTTKPSESYLKLIIRGIQETYDHLDTNEIVDYLISKTGVQGYYSRQELIAIIEK